MGRLVYEKFIFLYVTFRKQVNNVVELRFNDVDRRGSCKFFLLSRSRCGSYAYVAIPIVIHVVELRVVVIG